MKNFWNDCTMRMSKGSFYNGMKLLETMSGKVSASGDVKGDVETMSGSVTASKIYGDVSTMSGDINENRL